MLKIILAAWLFAQAPPAPGECKLKAEEAITYLSNIVADNPQFEIRIYDGERAEKIVAAFNAIPPQSDLRADRVIVMLDPKGDTPKFKMFFVNGNCITTVFPAGPIAAWADILKRSLGEGI